MCSWVFICLFVLSSLELLKDSVNLFSTVSFNNKVQMPLHREFVSGFPLLEGELKLTVRPAFQAQSPTPVSPTRARPPWAPLCRPTPGSAVLTTALLGSQTPPKSISWHLCPPSARWTRATRGVCRPKNMSWLPAVCRKKSKLVDLAHEDLVGGFQTVFLAPALPTPTPRGGHGAGASAAWIAHWALSPPPVSLQTPFLHSSFKTHLKHHLLHGESGPPSE